MTLSVDKGYLRKLKSATKGLLASAQEDVEKNNIFPWDEKPVGISARVGAGAVGIFGLVCGFYLSTELATNISESMNHYSHLLAPVTGVTQVGTSVVGTLVCTLAGIGAGFTYATRAVSVPYIAAQIARERKLARYQGFKKALYRRQQSLPDANSVQ